MNPIIGNRNEITFNHVGAPSDSLSESLEFQFIDDWFHDDWFPDGVADVPQLEQNEAPSSNSFPQFVQNFAIVMILVIC